MPKQHNAYVLSSERPSLPEERHRIGAAQLPRSDTRLVARPSLSNVTAL